MIPALQLKLACARGQRALSCPMLRNIGGRLAGAVAPWYRKSIEALERGDLRTFFASLGSSPEKLHVLETALCLQSSNIKLITKYASALNYARRYTDALAILKTVDMKLWDDIFFHIAGVSLKNLGRPDEAEIMFNKIKRP